jgi:glycoside/pentoside/hexuronide:cation symporter, GPH family
MNAPAAARVPLLTKLATGLSAVAIAIKDNGFGVFLIFYYNQVVGMPSSWVGLAIMIALFADALLDPLIGHFSDRTNTAWGRRHPWIYASAVPIALAWILIWNPPDWSNEALFWYLVGSAILMRAALSCNEVASTAIIPELTSDYHERTAIVRYRALFAWGFGLVMLYCAYAVFLVPSDTQPVGQLNREGYENYAVAGAIVMLVSILVAALGTHGRVAHRPTSLPPKQPMLTELRGMFSAFGNRAFVILMLATMFAYLNQGITFAMTNYLMTYVWLLSPAALSIYPLALFGGILFAFFMVPILAERLGKRAAAAVLALVAVVLGFAPYALLAVGAMPPLATTPNIAILFSFLALATGTGAGVVILIPSMLSDVVEAAQVKSGVRQEGLYFAGYFLTQKFCSGFSIMLTAQILTFSAFPARAVQGAVPADTLWTLVGISGALLLLFTIGLAAMMMRFPFGKAEHDDRLRQLAGSSA